MFGISKSVKLLRIKRGGRKPTHPHRRDDVSRGNFGMDATPKQYLNRGACHGRPATPKQYLNRGARHGRPIRCALFFFQKKCWSNKAAVLRENTKARGNTPFGTPLDKAASVYVTFSGKLFGFWKTKLNYLYCFVQ